MDAIERGKTQLRRMVYDRCTSCLRRYPVGAPVHWYWCRKVRDE